VVVLIGFQTASGNKDEAMALAQDVGQLAMAVCSTVEELKEEIAADTELLDQVSTYPDLEPRFRCSARRYQSCACECLEFAPGAPAAEKHHRMVGV
jgi:hypothetical protein